MENIKDDGITVTMPKALYDKLIAAQPEKTIEYRHDTIEVKRGAAPWLGFLAGSILISIMIYCHVSWGWFFIPGIVLIISLGSLVDEM